MTLIDLAHGHRGPGASWAPPVSSPADRWPTRRRASPCWAARAGFVGAVADDEVGRTYAENLRAAGVEFEPHLSESAAGDGLGHRPLRRAHHRGRRPHHGDLSGGGLDLVPSRCPDVLRRPRLHRPARGLPVGRAGRQGSHAPRRGHGPRRPRARWPSPCRTRSASSATSGSSSTSWSTTSTSCSGNEEEVTMLFGADSYEGALAAAEETGLLVVMTRGAQGATVLTARRARGGPGRRRRARWSTPREPGTSSPRGSSSGSRTAWARSRARASARCAPPR